MLLLFALVVIEAGMSLRRNASLLRLVPTVSIQFNGDDAPHSNGSFDKATLPVATPATTAVETILSVFQSSRNTPFSDENVDTATRRAPSANIAETTQSMFQYDVLVAVPGLGNLERLPLLLSSMETLRGSTLERPDVRFSCGIFVWKGEFVPIMQQVTVWENVRFYTVQACGLII
jgi:hypothetical protein